MLPASLSSNRVANDAIFVPVLDPAGREAFRAGTPWTPYLGAERPFGGDYHGILQGSVAFAAIDPGASSSLVIGGLPRSRLGFLALLTALTAGLILAAILLLRRERALASLRSEFVSRVSHELRTPLTQIRIFAETLLFDRFRSDEERSRALSIIDRESRRLSNLVENVLRFSRGERGGTGSRPDPGRRPPRRRDPSRFRASARRRSPARDPMLPASIRRPSTRAPSARSCSTCSTTPSSTARAARRSSSRPPRGGPGGDRGRGSGAGHPSRERERIWERFYRLERDRESPVAGTGIGLAVVRDLAVLQGGRAWVEHGRDGGSRFVVELPAGSATMANILIVEDNADLAFGLRDEPRDRGATTCKWPRTEPAGSPAMRTSAPTSSSSI